MKTTILTVLIAALLAVMPRAARGQSTRPTTQPSTRPAADIKLSVVREDGKPQGKRQIQATVTAAGKPVENAKVAFYVTRTFGDMLLGEDTTLDDGTAVVSYPEDLPGGASGQLDVFARIKSPDEYVASVGVAVFDGAPVVESEVDPFPRALWAPHAPVALLVTILGLLSGVWCTYAFVFVQLAKIRKADPRRVPPVIS